jgi:hypothetical protein
MIVETFEESFTYINKNRTLFLPDLVQLGINYLLLYLLYLYTGVNEVVSALSAEELTETIFVDVVLPYLSENWMELIISGAIYIFITFIVGVTVLVLKYEMITQALKKKKVSIVKAWKDRQNYFWHVVLLRILVYALTALAVLAGALVAGLAYIIVYPFAGNTIAATAAGVVALPVIILGVFTVKFAVFFRFPIMFFETPKAIPILRKALILFKRNPPFTAITWVATFALGIIFGIIGWLFVGMGNLVMSFIPSVSIVFVLGLVIASVQILLNLAAGLVNSLFIFLRYKQKG